MSRSIEMISAKEVKSKLEEFNIQVIPVVTDVYIPQKRIRKFT